MDKIEVCKCIRCKVDSLVPAIDASIRNVNNFNDYFLQPLKTDTKIATHSLQHVVQLFHSFGFLKQSYRIEHVWLAEDGFEVGAACENETADVDEIVGKEQLWRSLGNFHYVVVPFFEA